VGWMRDLIRKHRRPSLDPPPEPVYPDGLIRAQAELAKAEDTLTRLERQEPEVDAMSRRAETILRRNNLGPAFMRALGERRA
jgi:hypothetical protein